MYKLWIPIYNRKWTDTHKKKLVGEFSRLKPDLVLLTYARIICDEQRKHNEWQTFRENKEFLEENGFTVGAWLAPTIGYGLSYTFDNGAPFTKIHTLAADDDHFPGAFCPLDEAFVDEFLSVLKNIVDTGAKTILFEDDYTLSGGKGMFNRLGCCCPRHMAILRQKLGEDLTREQLREWVYDRGENPKRQVWLDVMGQTLRDFTHKVEEFVHGFDPEIRVGLSANASSFNIEGVGIDELARIIAGKNRPFLRLTGAPYWDNMPTFATNMEAARLQCHWCAEDIELIAEGDTYPRPRFTVSSSQLEIFDTVLRADGGPDGILKYMIDYNASPTYETGYVDRHLRNEELYAQIEKRFRAGKTEGLRVYENTALMREITFGKDHPTNLFFPYLPLVSQNFLCDNSIPMTYGDSTGAALVFGENAKHITPDMLNKGLILDAPAAKILMAQGVDIGIRDMIPENTPAAEEFPAYQEVTACSFEPQACFYRYTLKPGAQELSRYCLAGDGLGTIPPEGIGDCPRFPGCYLYENKQGQRFMVYAFAAETVLTHSIWNCGTFRNYCRQKQLIDGIEWIQRKPLPAVCPGNPFAYLLCKRDGNRLSVGVWNIFSDEMIEPEILLDREYASADCYRCEGHLEGRRLKLHGVIPPYGIALITLTE